MSTLMNGMEQSAAGNQPPAIPAVMREAFYLTSRGQPLFAWLHQPTALSQRTHGVVLCPPIGCEQIHGYRGLRHLADALARAGLAVLRFDYEGTGDSAGRGGSDWRLATWLENVTDALTWLERHLGHERISLVGLRLGASLAMLAATQRPVDNLVLWAPLAEGRRFVRELRLLSATREGPTTPNHDDQGDLEAAGFVYTNQMCADLGRVDLAKEQPRSSRVLIVGRDDLADDRKLVDHLTALGMDATQVLQPGFAEMVTDPHYTQVPEQAIATIAHWLVAGTSGEVRDQESGIRNQGSATKVVGTEPKYRKETAVPSDSCLLTPDSSSLAPTQCVFRDEHGSPLIRERTLDIRDPGLFGILSEPEAGAAADLPVIVLANAGAAYRAGPNRLYVELARMLSAQGFRCLRLDLLGLGDSVAANPADENRTYPATALRDVERAMSCLGEEFGAQRLILMGLCSGAHTAFQAAVQLPYPGLIESIMINPLTFHWQEGMSLDTTPDREIDVDNYYKNALSDLGKWWKVLSGRSRLGVVGAAKAVLRRLWRRIPHEEVPCASSPERGVANLPMDLERVAKAGRHLAFFFAKADPGYRLLLSQASKRVKELTRIGSLSTVFIAEADHTFSKRQARSQLVAAIVSHLSGRYPSADRQQ